MICSVGSRGRKYCVGKALYVDRSCEDGWFVLDSWDRRFWCKESKAPGGSILRTKPLSHEMIYLSRCEISVLRLDLILAKYLCPKSSPSLLHYRSWSTLSLLLLPTTSHCPYLGKEYPSITSSCYLHLM
jgi:hypothetical protein